MQNCKKINKIVSLLLVLFTMGTFFTAVPPVYAAHTMKITAKQFVQNDYSQNGVQNTKYGTKIDSYVLYRLNQAGIDVSNWDKDGIKLEDAVSDLVYSDITNEAALSAKVLAQDLAAATVLNKVDYANTLVQILAARQTTNGSNGIDANVSYDIPAFDLLGATGRINEMNTVNAKVYILGQQQNSTVNGVVYHWWGSPYYGTYYADLVTTAKAIRALHYLDIDNNDSDIQDAINNGLAWMKNQQKPDGSFVVYEGMDDPVKNTAEAIITLNVLGIDPTADAWKSSDGNSAVDYLRNHALNTDGSFAGTNSQAAALFLYAYNLAGLDAGDTALSLDPSSKTLDYGDQQQFTATLENGDVTTDVTADAAWSVYDSGVASMVYGGLVSANKVGTRTVQAVYNGLTGTAALTVNSPLSLDPPSKTMTVGDQQQFAAKWKIGGVTTDVTANATWSVTDSSVASIVNGSVKANVAGQTVVHAVYKGFTAAASLTVNSSSQGSNTPVTHVVKNVSMAVVGPQGNLLFGPSSFQVQDDNKWGLSVLGALDASGVEYKTSYWDPYGYSVNSIAGVAASGSGGWMYALNGKNGTKMAGNCSINNDDQIVFYWASSMTAQPPLWSDLVKLQQSSTVSGNSSGTLIDTKTSGTVGDSELSTAIKNADSTGNITIRAGDTKTSLVLSGDQFSDIVNKAKPLAVTVQGVQAIFDPGKLELADQLKKSDSQLAISIEKLSDWGLQNKVAPFSGGLKLAGEVYEFNLALVNKDGTQQKIEKVPGCKIALQVPEGVRASAQAGTVMAYWYDETGKKWAFMGGTYDQQSNTITFTTSHFSQYALLEATCSFDDIDGHWARKEIAVMAANGYVAGVNSNAFSPDVKISRAEFVTILAKIAGLTSTPDATKHFYDVPDNAWYRSSVDAAVYNGIVSGIDKDRFAPDKSITREEMAAMIERLMTKKGLNTATNAVDANKQLAGFKDIARISSWAQIPVAQAVQKQLMVGRENGQFVPRGNATRAEAAVVLYKVLQKLL
ncbi:MAG: hypothetical protein CVV03_00320 [Firmicutes bacterium HGW-Firmicutes-8]|nr:MAG: hypothetical protein CVV03_00320 [Firmicutes bacterium HGW-Firmicutes-8]